MRPKHRRWPCSRWKNNRGRGSANYRSSRFCRGYRPPKFQRPSFNVGTGFNQFAVNAVVIQPDGKIIVGGNFPSYNGISRPNLSASARRRSTCLAGQSIPQTSRIAPRQCAWWLRIRLCMTPRSTGLSCWRNTLVTCAAILMMPTNQRWITPATTSG